MPEKNKKVQLTKPMTWGGVNYAPGLNEMPEAAANYAVKKEFGKMNRELTETKSSDFTPLSFEETMKRFQEGDSSDEVFGSLKFHQQRIVEENLKRGGENGETKEKTEEKDKKITSQTEGLPQDFPMRHVFERLGFKTAAEVQAKTREELIALNGIAETTADKALAYGK